MASSTHNCLPLLFLLILLLLLLHPSLQQQEQPPSPKLSTTDLNTLLTIKTSLIDLPSSTFFSSWNFSSPDPCTTFAGLTCTLSPPSTLRVATLELGHGLFGSLGLSGSLPDSITQLTELTQLILNPGLITGPIPAQLGPLSKLRVLSLSHNRLTGPIPPSLALLTELHTLDLGFNRLTGQIPPTLLTNLTQLRVLILANNRLTGGLPGSTREAQLLHLDLKSNHLVGPIPPTLPLSIRYVSLSQNNLWGPITNGPLDSLPQLEYLDLSQNQFSGSLPTSLLRPSLSTLLLNHNNFSGELPEGLAGATTIFLNNNRFSGPVPEVYMNGLEDGTIKTLYLQHNFLDKFPTKNKHLGKGVSLPQEVEVCLSYNCMVPPSGLSTCPTSASSQVSRPADQCPVFHNN
ncbi:Receptor-like protein 12 [Bienertia sinuspersici]